MYVPRPPEGPGDSQGTFPWGFCAWVEVGPPGVSWSTSRPDLSSVSGWVLDVGSGSVGGTSDSWSGRSGRRESGRDGVP